MQLFDYHQQDEQAEGVTDDEWDNVLAKHMAKHEILVEKQENQTMITKTFSEPELFPPLEADSTSSPDASIQKKSHFQRNIVNSNEIINISSQTVSDSVTSTSDAIVFNDKLYSDCDDCIIADEYSSDSTENWYVGQIVWGALKGFTFWPAIIFNNADHTFQKGNRFKPLFQCCVF